MLARTTKRGPPFRRSPLPSGLHRGADRMPFIPGKRHLPCTLRCGSVASLRTGGIRWRDTPPALRQRPLTRPSSTPCDAAAQAQAPYSQRPDPEGGHPTERTICRRKDLQVAKAKKMCLGLCTSCAPGRSRKGFLHRSEHARSGVQRGERSGALRRGTGRPSRP